MRSDNGETAERLENSSRKGSPGQRVARTIERVHADVTAGRATLRSALQTVSLVAMRAGRDLEIEEAETAKRLRIVRGE